MSLPEKTRLFLPLTLLLCVSMVFPSYAQNWQEYHLQNSGNSMHFSRSVLFNGNILRQPDPTLGTVNATQSGSTWTFSFVPVTGAVGVAEFIVEYFPNSLPPTPKIESFRIYLEDSYIDAGKDFYSIQENSSDNLLAVTSNDTLHGGSTAQISYLAAVKHGTGVISGDGQSILFTPDVDFAGMAYMTYVICDNLGSCADAEVNICVREDGPLPLVDTIRLSTHSQASVAAILPLPGFEVSDGPDDGSVVQLSSDTWSYKSFADFSGQDAFVLTLDSLVRYVLVDVYFSDAPNSFVNHDVVFTKVDEPVTFDVLANDVKKYPIDAYTTPAKGVLTHDTLGFFTYIPDSAYSGAQIFEYTTCFLSNCETGEVVIYVGDMVPENTETYDLVTRKNVPLVLNYEVPINGYTFVIHAPPSNGNLTLYNEQQTIEVLCSTIEGFDLMVYTPGTDYSGNDYFEIVYCVDGECHLVKVNVEVENADPLPCPCLDHCVWPGDADGSGRVDLHDVLSIGWQAGNTGPVRNYPNNLAWMGQHAEDWNAAIWGMNSKYADSDGDGVITEDDIIAVSDYYLRNHTLIPKVKGLKADYAFELIPLTPQVDSGDVAILEISIGSPTGPVLDMHGIAFSLNLPVNLIDTSSVEIHFYDDSWLGHDAASLELIKQPMGSRIDAVYSRTTGKPATGVGVIGVMTFIVTDDIEGFKTPDGRVPIKIGVNAVSGMESSGLLYDVDGEAATVYLNTNARGNDLSLEDAVFVFPNPSRGDNLTIHANGERSLKQVDVYDLSGSQLMSFQNLDQKHFSPDVSSLGTGLYLLRITATDGVVSRKIEILK